MILTQSTSNPQLCEGNYYDSLSFCFIDEKYQIPKWRKVSESDKKEGLPKTRDLKEVKEIELSLINYFHTQLSLEEPEKQKKSIHNNTSCEMSKLDTILSLIKPTNKTQKLLTIIW